MDGLKEGELALLQILLEPAVSPWAESMQRTVIGRTGQAIFSDRPDLARGVVQKLASPLFGVVIRLVSCAGETPRAWELIADLASALSALARPGSNCFVPLNDEGYDASDHEGDILARVSRRSGMLLSLDELSPLLMPPTMSGSRKLRRETKRTRPAPDALFNLNAVQLGVNRHAGKSRSVFLSAEHRVRHMHVVGASGTGKSTLLLNMITQDMENGEGLAVFDPHGDLIDAVLAAVPAERHEDVILFDPSDDEYPVGFNILAAHSDLSEACWHLI
jgi:hypothetical protein